MSKIIRILVDIAKTEPQAPYSSFVSGFRHKLTYMMRTIPNISHLLNMFDDIVQHEFIPSITGGKIINMNERKLLSLPVKYGRLVLPIFAEISDIEFKKLKNYIARLVYQNQESTTRIRKRSKNFIKKSTNCEVQERTI